VYLCASTNFGIFSTFHDIGRTFGIPIDALPTIKSSSEIYATIDEGPFHGVPIAGCLGDQQAALVGQRCFQQGEAKNTYEILHHFSSYLSNSYGTGCFLLFNTGDKLVYSKAGLLTTVAYQLGPEAPITYALEVLDSHFVSKEYREGLHCHRWGRCEVVEGFGYSRECSRYRRNGAESQGYTRCHIRACFLGTLRSSLER